MQKKVSGLKVRALREARAWSQEQLAKVAGYSPRHIQRLEAGGTCSPQMARDLAQALEVTLEELQEFVPEKGEVEAWSEALKDLVILERVTSGSMLLSHIVGSSDGCMFDQDELRSEDDVKVVGAFLQSLQEWGEIWSEVSMEGRVEAGFKMTQELSALEARDLWLFAARKPIPFGSTGTTFETAVAMVVYRTNPRIVSRPEEPAAFAVRIPALRPL